MPSHFAINVFNATLFFYLLVVSQATALTDQELVEIRDGFDARRDTYLSEYLKAPLYEMASGMEACRGELNDAQWIWHPEENATINAPIGRCYFRRELTVSAERPLKNACIALASDNSCRVTINGREVGQANGFHRATLLEITKFLKSGVNIVAISAMNLGDAPNPAAILGIVYVNYEDGESHQVVTDSTWRVVREESPGWTAATYDDQHWPRARIVGPWGCAPWGEVAVRLDTQVNTYVFSRLTFALAALHLQTDAERANARIVEAVEEIRREHQSSGEFGLHWMGGVFYRIYGLFGPGGAMAGRLSDEAADAILHLFADWARTESSISESDPEQTWRIWGSENHSAQRDATRWAAARMIAASPLGKEFRYEDGSTATQQLAAWRRFLKRYYRERVKRGMLVEISPSGYGSRTLQGWHNIYDFTDDPELKSVVKAALDVWWADWAQEQLGGMRGGGKTRLYPGAWALSHTDRNRAMSWFYLGEGKPAHQHETLPVIATTTYRLPRVVMDIALDPVGRGVYECRSRRLGRRLDGPFSESLPKTGEPVYHVDPQQGGIVRYSYCTPDFIMGSLMFENRPQDYWTAISQQNRWHGVIFAGHADSTLYPRCDTDRSTYNAHWAIQNKGTLIAQKLRRSDAAKTMRVCFSTDLERQEGDGWIFARAARALAAVKIVHGDWQWEDERWLRCEDEYTPVIMEVVQSSDYDDFETFKKAVLQQPLRFKDGVLSYRGLNNSGEFTFFANSERAPELNGAPIDLAPPYAFESPFLNEIWASGRVHITKGNREVVVDVRKSE